MKSRVIFLYQLCELPINICTDDWVIRQTCGLILPPEGSKQRGIVHWIQDALPLQNRDFRVGRCV